MGSPACAARTVAVREQVRQHGTVPGLDRRHARLFDGVAALYDRVRPGNSDELLVDFATLAGIAAGSGAPEVGYGTGEATARSQDSVVRSRP